MIASSTRTILKQHEALIFLHIPKTAGITLHGIISRKFPKNATYNTWGLDPNSGRHRSWMDDFKQLPETDRARIRYMHLHPGPFGVHEHFPQPCRYVTVLRDPVDRVISAYFFILRVPQLRNQVFGDKATPESTSLSDFIRNRRNQWNLQTLMVSGIAVDSVTDPVNLPSDVMVVAKRNIQEHFALVGLSERFDESLALLRRMFGWRNTLYAKQNVTRKRPRKEDIPKETLRLIERYNELDIDLYDYARGEFERLIREQGSPFHREVQRFRVLNKVYQEVNRPSLMLRSSLSYGITRAEGLLDLFRTLTRYSLREPPCLWS